MSSKIDPRKPWQLIGSGVARQSISDIETLNDAEMERQREDLRDRRWARAKSKIIVSAVVVGVLVPETGVDHLMSVLRAAI